MPKVSIIKDYADKDDRIIIKRHDKNHGPMIASPDCPNILYKGKVPHRDMAKLLNAADAQPSVRVQDLLNNLGLEDRFITNTDQYKGKSTVLYNEEKINKYVNHSKQWLLESLK